MTTKKPSVFISYAHKDGMEFTRRLAFALSMYMDVFWDRRLQAGPYPPQLMQEIESRDFFLLIMSPYSLDSQWCKDEIAHAEKHGKSVVLAKIYENCSAPLEAELAKQYTYGDFTADFDAGFRRLSEMMLGHSYSSWEVYGLASDKQILDGLRGGFIPGLISKSIAEWIIVEKLWPQMESYIKRREDRGFRLFFGLPRTPMGILRQCELLLEQFSSQSDVIGVHLAQSIQEIVQPFFGEIVTTYDERHAELGDRAYRIIESTKLFLEENSIASIQAYQLSLIRDYYDFEVAEELRELINVHARRSRYLY